MTYELNSVTTRTPTFHSLDLAMRCEGTLLWLTVILEDDLST